jgi:hypothetical protein
MYAIDTHLSDPCTEAPTWAKCRLHADDVFSIVAGDHQSRSLSEFLPEGNIMGKPGQSTDEGSVTRLPYCTPPGVTS